MEAFHSFWSKPNAIRNQGRIVFPDFELFTAILSALEWKKHNGPIRMITDQAGADYFSMLGIDRIWDEIDPSLEQIDQKIDPFLFWAGGKLFALQQMDTPCVMLDTDLIIWKNCDWVQEYDLVTAHPEDLNPHVYPHQSIFQFEGGYEWPEDWDFSEKAANTAFLYVKNSEFRDSYVEQAIRFFRHVKMDGLNPVTAMCFAEQRIIAMEAAAKQQKMGYLLDLARAEEQDFVTHTWGYKQAFHMNAALRAEFCMKCAKRIVEEFPEMQETLSTCMERFHKL